MWFYCGDSLTQQKLDTIAKVVCLLNRIYAISILMLSDVVGERVLTWMVLAIQYVFVDAASSQETI